jgi:hypothetical protein
MSCCSLNAPKLYVDVVANIAFFGSLPFMLLIALFIAFPTLLWISLSYWNFCDCLAYMVWFVNHNFIAFPINFMEKHAIYAISFLLYPTGYFVYYFDNQKIINFIEQRTGTEKIKYRGMKFIT